MGTLIQIAQFILSLSILIVLHELGHFIPAKLFKTKVEKFYLFFDPWFSLFKVKRGDTEYGIGWLPLGGYVKISGMIDESMDKEQMKLPPQDWEFRSKPAWQRLIIMVGGVSVNVVLGVLIYAMVLYKWGEVHIPIQNVTYGITCDSLAEHVGLRDGDKIISINNVPVKSFDRVIGTIILETTTSIEVDRDGKKLDIPVTPLDRSEMIKQAKSEEFVSARMPCIVDSVAPGMSAEKAGFKKRDQIISINNTPSFFFKDVSAFLKKHPLAKIDVQVLRGKDTMLLHPEVSMQGTLGFFNIQPIDFLKTDTTHYGLLASFPAGVHKAYQTFGNYLKQFKVIFTVKDAHKQIGGFGTIASAYSTSWDWEGFWAFTAFLSIVLAIMNILPIPALDGGHVMFLLYEIITRRKPNEKFMEYAQYAGMFLLLALLLYANGNDIIRHFFK